MKKEELKRHLPARPERMQFMCIGEAYPVILVARLFTVDLQSFTRELDKLPKDEVFTIGRGKCCDYIIKSNDVNVSDEYVSNIHCWIEKNNLGIVLHDVSLNGTEIVRNRNFPSRWQRIKDYFRP